MKDIIQNSEKFIYLLTNDGHRDSVCLNKGSLNIDGLKKHLIQEQLEMFGNVVLPNSIILEDKGNYGWISFKYTDFDNDIEDGRYGFFKLEIM